MTRRFLRTNWNSSLGMYFVRRSGEGCTCSMIVTGSGWNSSIYATRKKNEIIIIKGG